MKGIRPTAALHKLAQEQTGKLVSKIRGDLLICGGDYMDIVASYR